MPTLALDIWRRGVALAGLVELHGAMNDVNEVAFEDAAGAAGPFGGLVACGELLGGGVKAVLHNGRCVEHAVEAAVSSAVKAIRSWSEE
jgi:hypothetical protein